MLAATPDLNDDGTVTEEERRKYGRRVLRSSNTSGVLDLGGDPAST